MESCAAHICREAGARVSTNIRVQDLDLLPGGQLDDRRLGVVVDGLPLFHGAQLAIDTTLVSPVRADGAPRRQCATRDGAALDQARRTKEPRHPELMGEYGSSLFARRWSERPTTSCDTSPVPEQGRNHRRSAQWRDALG